MTHFTAKKISTYLACGILAGATLPAIAEQQPDYGAGAVNSMGRTEGTKVAGREDYNYLALENHIGPSGVPVGGIGVGCFDYAPNGSFTRFAINNWHEDGVIKDVHATFLALWEKNHVQILQRGQGFFQMSGANRTVYTGLFPIAENKIDDRATVRVWSGLVPHNLKDSSLPLAWVEVTIANDSNASKEMAVAFSWQDIIGRMIRDVGDPRVLEGYGNTVWARNEVAKKTESQPEKGFRWMPRVATDAALIKVGKFTGIRQHSDALRPYIKTYQNYNNEVAILVEQEPKMEVSTLPSYALCEGASAWRSFRDNGFFPPNSGECSLFAPGNGNEMASAVAAKTMLAAGEKKTVRFVIAWFQPEMKIDPSKDDPKSYFGKADYARMYHNYFQSLPELIAYAAAESSRIFQGTRDWQAPILQSSYPDWLKFKLVNSGYVVYTNAILNKAGDFSVLEGAMGGLAGTMDQRLSAHPFYHKLFTEADRSELELFGHSAGKDGEILHFDGHYYTGLATRDGATPTPGGWMVDNSGGWLVQIAKDYQTTGDLKWLEQFHKPFARTIDFLLSIVKSQSFFIPTGSTTYDDFWHPEIYAYNASCFPAFLRAGAVLHRAFGETSEAEKCEQLAKKASEDFIHALWNGRFFAYGCNLNGYKRLDNIMFSGQLAGQFISRYCGWGDIIPLDYTRASLVAQFKTNVGNSAEFYAPKVWNIADNQAMQDPNRKKDHNNDSTCWPFYLESYTAMAAIQAGYVQDGLEILRKIQLVHLRNGWTWTQNLWRPGEITYMTAPVTWFITDVLAGASLDQSQKMLTLGPVIENNENKIAMPLYYPGFWGMVRSDRATKTLKLEILRTFGNSPLTLDTVRALPVGVPSKEAKAITIKPFTVRAGAILDLSSNWDALTSAKMQQSLLKCGKAFDWLTVGAVRTTEASAPPQRASGFSLNVQCSDGEEYSGTGATPLSGATWNQLRVGSVVLEAENLRDGNGAPVSTRVTFEGFTGCYTDQNSGQNVAGFENLMGNYAFLNARSGQTEAQIAVSGLDSAKKYAVYLFGLGNGKLQNAAFRINGIVKTTNWPNPAPAASLQNDFHYVRFEAVSEVNGTLKISVINLDPANHPFAICNGFQIVEIPGL